MHGTEPRQSATSAGIAWMAVGVFVMSIMDAMAKWIVAVAPTLEIIGIRSLMAFVIIAPMVWHAGGLRMLATRRIGAHAVRAALAMAAVLCFFEALRHLPLATVVAICFAAPLFMTVLSVPMLGERVGIHRWSAVGVGFIGVLVMTRPEGGGWFSLPAILALASALFYAIMLVATRWLARTETDVAMLFYQNLFTMVTGGLALPFIWVSLTLFDLAIIAAMAVTLAIGQFCTIRAFRLAPVGAVAPFQYTELVWAVIFGYAVWNEIPAPAVWLGSALVIGSGLYILWRETRRRRG